MCGISGIYQFKNANKAALREAVGKINFSQKNRGPDDEGVFINSITNNSITIALGHRRLSILDLSKSGHQPMTFIYSVNKLSSSKSNNSITITFNGEIYNFSELKKELERKGYNFKTKTDTEVILALYAEYGEKSFAMLRGMFAFGLWDEENKKLFLVKDRYGIKPLYYFGDGEKLIFASTVKAVAASGLIPVEKNPQAFIGFLLFGSVPLPLTTLKNVFAVPAGHYLEIGADGKQKSVQYYESLSFFNARGTSDVQEIARQTRQFIQESVNLHLVSDAPLGVFLSGGLDSSVIAALAANAEQMRNGTRLPAGRQETIQKNQRLITLSIIFDEKEFSEEYYSDLVAEKIGSDHRKIKITKRDFHDSFGEIFEAMDQPTIDGVNTFFIVKAAKQAGLKAVLSGLGADEIFLGYPHFRRAEFLRKIQRLPKVFKLPLKLGNLFGDRCSKLSYFANDDILSFYLGIRGVLNPLEAAKALDIGLSEINDFIYELNHSLITDYQLLITKLPPVNLLSYLELKFYLQNQLLKDTDFMSMHHSVEVRVPFLDNKLVEYVSGLPPEVKLKPDIKNLKFEIKNSRPKPLLISAAHEVLPREVWDRDKMGFTFPFQKWFDEKHKNTETQEQRSISGHWSRFWAKKVLEKFK